MKTNGSYWGQVQQTAKRQRKQEALEVVPVVARYTSNAGQSIPNNTVTIVNFEDEDFDTRDAVAVGAGWTFTAPVGGYYQVNARVQFAAAGTFDDDELLALDIYVNGAQVSRIFGHELWDAGTIEAGGQGCDLVHLDKDDTLNIRVLQVSGGAQTLTTDGTENHVAIHRVT